MECIVRGPGNGFELFEPVGDGGKVKDWGAGI